MTVASRRRWQNPERTYSIYGAKVDVIKDVDGDGVDDVVVAVHGLGERGYQGAVYIMTDGSSNGALVEQAYADVRMDTPEGEYAWGDAIAVMDLNRDGLDDVVSTGAELGGAGRGPGPGGRWGHLGPGRRDRCHQRHPA